MKTKFRLALAVLVAIAVAGCGSAGRATTGPADHAAAAAQSPLDVLKEGNRRFAQGRMIHEHQNMERLVEVAQGQHPIAIIVGCSDSRVTPEIIFDQGLGDLFVVRVAGNVVDDQALGSIEYAVEHLHVGLVVVLGHDRCGAVAAAVSGADAPGHIQSIVEAIHPAVDIAKTEPGDLLDNAINENVRRVVEQLRTAQPILGEEVGAGHLRVVGARYLLDSGVVRFFGGE
jgi:carbonic anhydrase